MGKWMVLLAGLTVSACLLAGMAISGSAVYHAREETRPPLQALTLPCPVEGTELLAVELASFEGPFYEDGTGDEVAEVCALVVENRGGTTVYEGCVTVQAQGRELVFRLSWLPPGARALVPEQGRAGAYFGGITACSGWSTGIYPEYTGAVTAHAQNEGIRLENHTTQTIGRVCVVYRQYDRESGMYIGGFSTSASRLAVPPGVTVLEALYPYRHDSVRIVGVLVSQT